MKAITLRQPWAWLVLHGKDFENRKQRSGFVGNVLIHSSLEQDNEIHLIRSMRTYNHGKDIPDPSTELEFGGIVGVARFGRWRLATESIWANHWGGYPIEATQVLPFFPCKGRLGFWDFPDEDYMRLLNKLIDRGGPCEHPDPDAVIEQWASPGFFRYAPV